MRHQKTRHKLSRTSSHRKSLLANLCVEVIETLSQRGLNLRTD